MHTQERYNLAIENYKKSIRIDASNSETYSNLGISLLANNQKDSALKYFKSGEL